MATEGAAVLTDEQAARLEAHFSEGAASAETWRGLTVAPEQRCSPYRAGDYSYPQSVEAMIVAQTGKVYGSYTGRCFASRRETDIEHMVGAVGSA